MKTQLISVDPASPEPEAIRSAAAIIRGGGLVAFPTETVYGLGANAMDGEALARIFTAKQRPTSDPIIAHVGRVEQMDELAQSVPDIARDLAAHFWPGPLTMILKRHPSVPDLIAEGRDTVAIRMPAHPVARALLDAAAVPIGAPSANRFTRPSATRAAHVLEDLDGRIDMLIDGGDASIGLESTVLDLTGATPRVLRPGGLTLEALREVLPGAEFAPAYTSEAQGHQSPGQMLKHYSPRATVILFRGRDRAATLEAMRSLADDETRAGKRVAALLSSEDADALDLSIDVAVLGSDARREDQARYLFAALRDLDERQADVILVRDPDSSGLGQALSDRLLRAAVGRVVDCNR